MEIEQRIEALEKIFVKLQMEVSQKINCLEERYLKVSRNMLSLDHSSANAHNQLKKDLVRVSDLAESASNLADLAMEGHVRP